MKLKDDRNTPPKELKEWTEAADGAEFTKS